jgi:hypothetical protein
MTDTSDNCSNDAEVEFMLQLMTKLRAAYEQVLNEEMGANKHLLVMPSDAPVIEENPNKSNLVTYLPGLLRIIQFLRHPKLQVNRVKRDFKWFANGAMKAAKAATLPETPESQARLEVCKGCDQWTGKSCKVCGCFVSLKVKIPEEKCPLGKW